MEISTLLDVKIDIVLTMGTFQENRITILAIILKDPDRDWKFYSTEIA